MSKFDHILKHQEGGSFAYTSAALPTTELDEINIDPSRYMSGSQTSPAEGAGGGPQAPGTDYTAMAKYKGHQGDFRNYTKELQSIDAQLAQLVRENKAGGLETTKGMELLSRKRDITLNMKNDLERELAITKEAETNAKTTGSKGEYLSRKGNTGQEFLVQDQTGEYKYANWFEIQKTNSDGDKESWLNPQRIGIMFKKREHESVLRHFIAQTTQINGIDTAIGELRKLANDAATVGGGETRFTKENLSALESLKVVGEKGMESMSGDDDRMALIRERITHSSNINNLNKALALVTTTISQPSLNVINSHAAQSIEVTEEMTKEEYDEAYKKEKLALIISYMSIHEIKSYDSNESILSKGDVGSGNVYPDGGQKAQGLQLLYGGISGMKSVSVGDRVFSGNRLPDGEGTITRDKKTGKRIQLRETDLYFDLIKDKFRVSGLNPDKETSDTWENYIATGVIVEDESLLLTNFPVDATGKPVSHLHADEAINAQLTHQLMVIAQGRKETAELEDGQQKTDQYAALDAAEEVVKKTDGVIYPVGEITLEPVMKMQVIINDESSNWALFWGDGYTDKDKSTVNSDIPDLLEANPEIETAPSEVRRVDVYVPVDKSTPEAIVAQATGVLKTDIMKIYQKKKDDISGWEENKVNK